MKARNTKTGEEITILRISKKCGTATYIEDGIIHQNNLSKEWKIIDESALIDWQAFRREAAKDILAGFAARIGHPMSDYSEQSCKYAIQLADELIKQLKEEKQ